MASDAEDRIGGMAPLSDAELRRSVRWAVLLALLLPPFVGGSLMGLVGFYPMPEFYLIFTDYSGPYVVAALVVGALFIRRAADYVIELPRLEPALAKRRACRLFARLPWLLLVSVTVYSMFGILSADLSMERMGYRDYSLYDHLYSQFGIIPVVLLTTFPIFFFALDRLGRYLGPRGIEVVAVPLRVRLAMLGIVAPVMIDCLLIGYYANETGFFTFTTFFLWLSLLVLAMGGTWVAWHSQRQATAPLQRFLDATDDTLPPRALAALVPLSLDEFGVLTARLARLLHRRRELSDALERAESFANAVVDNAGALVVVLDREGRMVRFNRACEVLSGYSFAEVEGRCPWWTVLPPEQAETVRREAFEAVARDPGRDAGHYVNEWLTKGGERRLIEWFNTLILDAEGAMAFMVSVGVDITEKRKLESAVAASELRYRTFFEQSRDGILVFDPRSGLFTDFNDVAHRQLGYSREEFARMRIADFEVLEDEEDVRRHVALIEERGWDNFETLHRHKDGTSRNVQVIVQLVQIDGESLMFCTFRDITERKRREASLHLYANVFEHSGEAIMITDADNRIVAGNRALTEHTGYTLDELAGQNPSMLASGHTPRETYEEMWRELERHDYWQGELWDRRKDGGSYPKWAAISRIHDEHGELSHYIASFTDISERKAAEERIDYLAHHDPLTGLVNRYSLETRLEQVLLGARRERERVAVMFIDMDRFKIINDSLGHQAGDSLLMEVAQRLRAHVRESDIVARIGGDEFVIVLAGMAVCTAAAPIAAMLVHALGQSYHVGGSDVHSTPSIGISLYPDDGEEASSLLKNADTAMYHAKEQGRNNFQFFTAEMNRQVAERMTLETELRIALDQRRFELHYQPQVDPADGRPRGVEALVRWRHPERGLVPPDKFIPVAEETGLIGAIGEWVLDEACRQLAQWRAEGIDGIRMAVNLSSRQLRSSHLVEQVEASLRRHGLGEGELELEVTESAAMENPERAVALLNNLRGLGVLLSIDDFGTGYSSLAYLKQLPIHTLKLDRAFVGELHHSENDAAISAATIALAHNLGLKVVGEGVENGEQRAFLVEHGCDLVQGYLFSRPLPAAEATRWLREARE